MVKVSVRVGVNHRVNLRVRVIKQAILLCKLLVPAIDDRQFLFKVCVCKH